MSDRKHTGPEPWETRMWEAYDAVKAARETRGQPAADALSRKVLAVVVQPKQPKGK
jgi:hypothetical protein